MLKIKVFICQKTLSNHIRIQKCSFKKQKPRILCLNARADHGKTYKIIKALRVKCVTVTSITNGNVMTHNKRCLLFRHGDEYH